MFVKYTVCWQFLLFFYSLYEYYMVGIPLLLSITQADTRVKKRGLTTLKRYH
jgi:hypothetical protein